MTLTEGNGAGSSGFRATQLFNPQEFRLLVPHRYCLSLATYRIRMALKLKGVAFKERMQDLAGGDQHPPAFHAPNPVGAVPA